MLLALETTGDVCGVALAHGGTIVYEAALHLPRAHGAHLAPMVEQAFARAGVTPADLRVVAVSAGPGSYTGLRIGVSTAKGLCLASGAALVAVPTLAGIARGARGLAEPGVTVLAALPSRRGEVYLAVVDDGDPTGTPAAAAHTLDSLVVDVGGEGAVLVVGPAADAVAKALTRAGRAGVRAVHVVASAAHVAALGAARLAAGLTEDVAAFEPDYVTPAYVGIG